MFKQHYVIIFIALLVLAHQFQFLHPAYVECLSHVFVRKVLRPFAVVKKSF